MTTNLQRLLGLGGWNVAMLSHDGATRRNMLLLIQLRWLAVAGQVATIAARFDAAGADAALKAADGALKRVEKLLPA